MALVNSYGPIEPSLQGAQRILGNWNASTNTPFLIDGVGTPGDTYIVSVAGTQNLGHGSVNYNVGDQVYFTTGGIWDVIAAGNSVVSVNGQTGIVELALDDLVDVAIAAAQNRQSLIYNSTTQVWENGTLTNTDVGLSNVPNINATDLANDNIGTLTLDLNPIIDGDNGEVIAGKTQGQINGIDATLAVQESEINELQTNAVQSVNGVIAKNLILGNGTNTTVVTTPAGDTVTLLITVNQATTAIPGAAAIATLAEVNMGTDNTKYITASTLANSNLSNQVATNTTNISNLQNTAIQTVNSLTGNNILNVRDAQGNAFIATDSGNTTILSIPNATNNISGLIQYDNYSIKNSLINSLQVAAPLSQATNFLMNAQFNIWQRGTSFNITTQTKTFTADRWWIDTQTASFVGTITASRNPANNTIVSGYLADTRYRILTSTSAYTSGTAYLCQSIENVLSLTGPVVFTVGIASVLGASISVDIVQYYGTGGAPSANVVTNLGTINYPPGNLIQNFSLSGIIPSSGGKVLGTNGDSCVVLRITLPPMINTALTFANIQLQRGSISTGFDVTPVPIDLANCQAYCASFQTLYSGDASNGATYFAQYKLSVTMRATPTLIGTATNLTNLGFPATVGTLTFNSNFIQEVRTCNALLGQNGATFSSTGLVQSELTY